MTSFFNLKDRWGNRYTTWGLAILFMTLLPLILHFILQIKMENNVESWLSDQDPQVRLLSWYRKNFPVKERTIVSWDNCSLGDPRIAAFKMKLEGVRDETGHRHGGSPFVESVTTPNDILQRYLDQHVSEEDALYRLKGILVGTGSLKVQLSEAGVAKKNQAIEQLKVLAKSELDLDLRILDPKKRWKKPQTPPEGNEEDSDEEAKDEKESASFALTIPVHHFQVIWKGYQPDSEKTKKFIKLVKGLKGRASQKSPKGLALVNDCFQVAGASAAVIVDLNDTGKNQKATSFAEIRIAAEEVGIPQNELHMGGRSIAAETLNSEVVKASWNQEAPIWNLPARSVLILSGLVGALLSFLVMRSIRLAALVLIVSYYTTIATVALVPATGGTMNMVLVVMPTLLLVLTLSGAIHVANYWKHAYHENPETAVVRAFEMAKQPCILASITTAIGLGSLATSRLFPVRDFGIYSAAGCLISLLLVLIALPALLQLFGGKVKAVEEQKESLAWIWFGGLVHRHYVVITSICVIVFIVGSLGLFHFQTETKVIRYFPESSKIVQDYRKIEENVVGIIPIDTIIKFDTESQEDGESEEQGTQFTERLEVVRQIAEKIRQHSEISGVVSLADSQPARKKPADDASMLTKIRFNKRSYEMKERILEGELPTASTFFKIATEDVDWKTEGDRKLSHKGDELWRITAQGYIMSENDYDILLKEIDEIAKSVCKNHPGTSHLVTGMVPVFLRTQQAVLESLVYSFTLAFGVIAVIMMILLRNPIAGMITMLPNLLPVGVTFGMISWLGWKVDVGTMITASVALGIAVDGTLHLLTWFRKGLLDGMTPKEAIQQGLMHCGPAMSQTSGIVAIGLLMLAPSSLLLISRFGCLMATLVGAALIADLVFLPALLAGPLGRLIQSTTLPEKETTSNLDNNHDLPDESHTELAHSAS